MNGERCKVCDRFNGWENDPHKNDAEWEARGGCLDGCSCEGLCWGAGRHQCTGAAVDWRERFMAAAVERDAALAEVERLKGLLGEGDCDADLGGQGKAMRA